MAGVIPGVKFARIFPPELFIYSMKKYLLHFGFAAAFIILLVLSPFATVDAQIKPKTTPGTTNSGGSQKTVQDGLGDISAAFPDTVVDKDTGPQELAKTVIEYALYLSGILAVIFIIYGGYQYIFSGGSDDKAKEGRKTLTNALIGLAIVVFAFIIVQVVYKFLINEN